MNAQRCENAWQRSPAAGLDVLQADALATVLSRNLHNEPNLVYMVPDEDTRRFLAPSFFLSAIRAGQLYGEILMTENSDAAAVWIRPERDPSFRRMVRTGPVVFSFNQGWEAATRYVKLGASVEEVRSRLAQSPHWYLMVFGVEASCPEKSIVEALIEPVLSRADLTGTPCYLETFNGKRLTFYKDLGFRITGAGRIPEGGPNFWAMTRAPTRTALQTECVSK